MYLIGSEVYQLENTSSHTIAAVKQCWARCILGCKTVQVLPTRKSWLDLSIRVLCWLLALCWCRVKNWTHGTRVVQTTLGTEPAEDVDLPRMWPLWVSRMKENAGWVRKNSQFLFIFQMLYSKPISEMRKLYQDSLSEKVRSKRLYILTQQQL